MKILLMILLFIVICFSGCSATDKAYGVGKGVYGVGKAGYKVSGAKNETLENIDNMASKYDEARSLVRGQSESKKLHVDTLEVSEK